MSTIAEPIALLREKSEALEQQQREINRQIEDLQFQGVKQSSRFKVTLQTQSDTEVKYARDREHADKLVNNWRIEVAKHPGCSVDWVDEGSGFKYRYTAKDWTKIEREYAGMITVEVNSEYRGDDTPA